MGEEGSFFSSVHSFFPFFFDHLNIYRKKNTFHIIIKKKKRKIPNTTYQILEAQNIWNYKFNL